MSPETLRLRPARNHHLSKPPSPSPRRKTLLISATGRSTRRPKPVESIRRSYSEPCLRRAPTAENRWKSFALYSDHHEILPRPHTCADVFTSSPSLFNFRPSSPNNSESGIVDQLNRDMKVVINVLVEGSPGPVRMMVKLGCTVGETIKLVLDKYGEEGRTPKLDPHSSFELLPSYFSLQSLEKTELIGGVGGRSFYLRKSCGGFYGGGTAEIDGVVGRPPPGFLLPGLIAKKVGKFARRTRRICRVFCVK